MLGNFLTSTRTTYSDTMISEGGADSSTNIDLSPILCHSVDELTHSSLRTMPEGIFAVESRGTNHSNPTGVGTVPCDSNKTSHFPENKIYRRFTISQTSGHNSAHRHIWNIP